jgi:hypothetical protein
VFAERGGIERRLLKVSKNHETECCNQASRKTTDH